ncbi:MAG TPA: pyruvate, phosphate dikinase, partial [Acidobacteria bacterium]|nr:pyruvate, phosphate dikinase [Acidobacteriota bacterium]
MVSEGPSWKERLEDLNRRRPELAERACRTLLTEMHRRGLIDLDELDDEFAIILRLGVRRRRDDPNRPLQQLPSGSSRTFYELAIKHAERHLSDDEITAIILQVEKTDLAYDVARAAEDFETPLADLRQRIHRFLSFAPNEAVVPQADVTGTRAALVRRLMTESLAFISVAKRYVKVRDIAWLLDRVVRTEGNQGRIGGKAAGLVLARSILLRAKEQGRFDNDVIIPESWFVPSNGILEFMEHNGLEELIHIKYRPVEEVRREYPLIQRLFKSSSFPPTLREGLREMLDTLGEGPLVVRSSSLLEDRIGHAFSGKYKSLFILNQGPMKKRLEELEDAIAEVYASTLGPDPIEYRRERGLLDFQEQMGILIQKVVGQNLGGMVFPSFAGVAFSLCEMRWASRIQRTDGMARLVVGLGTRAVDRTGDDYPVLVALKQPTLRAVQQPDEVYRYSQHTVDVVDLEEGAFDSIPLPEFMRRVGRKFRLANRVFSIYRDGQILPLIGVMAQFEPDELVVTFDGLLRSDFPAKLKTMLDLLEEGLGEPVDVELAHDGTHLNLLQCRALTHRASARRVVIPSGIPPERQVFSAERYVQTGQIRDQEWIVLVDPRDYERLPTEEDMRRVAR